MSEFNILGLISKNSSIVSGSLTVTGNISNNLSGTASYTVSSSQSIYSLTASNTAATSIDSSSYSIRTVSSSISLTSSAAVNFSYGPTPGIGCISPNIIIGAPISVGPAPTSVVGGTLLCPVIIPQNCTLVTMSIVGTAAANTTCSLGIYTNSTSSNIPQFLLAEGIIRTGSIASPTLFNVSNFAPVKLTANTVYWVAFLSNSAGSNSAFGYMRDNNITGPSSTYMNINPLLNTRTFSGSVTYYWHHSIQSGSIGVGLATTASQSTGSYTFMSLPVPYILPVLRVVYN